MEDDDPALMREKIRQLGRTIIKSGKQKELKEVFGSFGVSKLAELEEDDYNDAIAKMEEVISGDDDEDEEDDQFA